MGSVVAREEPVLHPIEREAEPVAEPPLGQVDHRLEGPHLRDRLRREHGRIGVGDEGRPAAEVAWGTPELGGRSDGVPDDHRLFLRDVRVRRDEIAPRHGILCSPRRPGHPQRAQHPLVEVSLGRLSRDAGDDLPEKREREVRVVPVGAGRENSLALGQARQELIPSRHLQGLPDLSRNLPLDPGEMCEQRPKRRPVRGLGQVPVEGVVEIEPSLVAQLHQPDGSDGLRDRGDPVLVVGRRLLLSLRVGEPDGVRPDDLAVVHRSGAHRRQALLGLCRADDPLELGREGVRRGQGFPTPEGQSRSRARCRRR